MITTGRRKRITIEDVARRAGVSRNTVSNVLNGRPVVSALLRERVLAAVRELDYYPDHLARQFVTGRTQTIGVFLPATPEVLLKYFIAEILSGALETAARLGYDLRVHSQYGRAADPIDLRALRDTRIDAGLLIDDGRMTVTNIGEVERARIPFVVVGYDLNHPNTNWILVDKEEGA
jgi:LacI family transcriptional regulator